MKINEKAIEAAVDAWDNTIREMPQTLTEEMLSNAMRNAIEAYEAARWRPIEEAPRDGTTIQIYLPKLQRPFTIFANWEDPDWGGPGFRVGCVLFEIGDRHLKGAMFRTIDPPTKP